MATTPPTGVDGAQRPTADPPPPTQNKTVDEVVADMKKMPLFMTSLDDLDEDNALLEAMKALAYEGTRAEVADNFRAQGNDCVKAKQWRDAREFYSKALAALKSPSQPPPPDAEVVEVDSAAEAKRERALEEACYANRALCNLEMKNYGSCNRDCAAALRVHPRNVKAWYRAASACLALDKLPEALDACQRGLECDAHNAALQTLLQKVEKRTAHVAELEKARREREHRTAREAATLRLALRQRNIATRSTQTTPDLEDAAIRLASPLDASSALTLPLVLLYPLHAQSDFVKACAETDTLAQHLAYIFPLPWDAGHEYTVQSVECYMETTQGGLIKAGKNLSVVTLLGSGKVEVVDGLVRVNVVPKARGREWIADFKRRSGRSW
ncbi:HSP70/90 co-chaperone [Teratosphaeriaceae sp. CCFEE 6253]|nr:HSP70/90 co-chaperone [Teratosphaeriaceae sp. CCFEE 6253]